jgi:hypothetical protein
MNYFIIVIVIQIILLGYILLIKNKKETFIQLRDDHKKQYNKCCNNERCYSKPPHLRKSECVKISENARNSLMKHYQQMYSNDEYNEIIRNIITNKNIKFPPSIDERVDLLISGEEREKLYRETVKPYEA